MSYKPTSPPPSYHPQTGYANSPQPQGQGAANDYYGGGQGYPQQGYPQQGYPQQQGYPPQQGYPQQQGYYGQQNQMYYPPQQQGYPPQQGYFQGDRGNHGGSGAGGLCAGIMAAFACCCCLDLLF